MQWFADRQAEQNFAKMVRILLALPWAHLQRELE